jgi:ABC-type transport system involved in multi-copper enzyme maturation permease subunit
VLLALLGLGFVAAFMAIEGTTEGLGYWAAVGIGVLGGVALLVAIAATVGPTVLYEGPDALKKASHAYDRWSVIGRAIAVLAGLGIAAIGLNRSAPLWLRGVAPVVGLAFAGLFLVGSVTKGWSQPPAPYLVPYGLLLGGIGLVYIAASLAVVSDSPVVVIARRELAAYFYSPIAYLVLFGMSFAAAWAYLDFLFRLGVVGSLMEAEPSNEPIVQMYMAFGILGAFTAVFLVPAVTMRLFSEETRTGTLEVLMTAPVTEASVVLGKFVAAWVFFMVCWIPAGLYLIALWSAGGAFDYRPLLAFYLALGCSGAAFLGMGMFFSTLTRNQIIAAVLTFSGMMFLLLTVLAQEFAVFPPGLRAAFSKLDFLNLWVQSLSGQLPVQAILIQLSMGVFWLFLTTKVLEARKWS